MKKQTKESNAETIYNKIEIAYTEKELIDIFDWNPFI